MALIQGRVCGPQRGGHAALRMKRSTVLGLRCNLIPGLSQLCCVQVYGAADAYPDEIIEVGAPMLPAGPAEVQAAPGPAEVQAAPGPAALPLLPLLVLNLLGPAGCDEELC